MAKVAWCESRYRQFNEDGSVLRGVVNSQDVGVFQINEKYHLETAKELNIDIYTTVGNVAYAIYLYNNQGLSPWEYSSECWNNI